MADVLLSLEKPRSLKRDICLVGFNRNNNNKLCYFVEFIKEKHMIAHLKEYYDPKSVYADYKSGCAFFGYVYKQLICTEKSGEYLYTYDVLGIRDNTITNRTLREKIRI